VLELVWHRVALCWEPRAINSINSIFEIEFAGKDWMKPIGKALCHDLRPLPLDIVRALNYSWPLPFSPPLSLIGLQLPATCMCFSFALRCVGRPVANMNAAVTYMKFCEQDLLLPLYCILCCLFPFSLCVFLVRLLVGWPWLFLGAAVWGGGLPPSSACLCNGFSLFHAWTHPAAAWANMVRVRRIAGETQEERACMPRICRAPGLSAMSWSC
jgi:hypothetical protein